jgi:hypothetical protein
MHYQAQTLDVHVAVCRDALPIPSVISAIRSAPRDR